MTGQFLREVTPVEPVPGGLQPGLVGSPVTGLDDLNRLFRCWAEAQYHQTPNDTTGQPPARRWADGLAARPARRADPAKIAEAFLWSARRTVTAGATVQLFNNTYQVDPALIGRRVELVYDPFDLTAPIRVEDRGRPAGRAAIVEITRHSHRKAEAAARDETRPAGGPATGVDYLRLLEDRHDRHIRARGIDYTALAGDDEGPRP